LLNNKIIKVVKSLSITTVAERIETKSQYHFLKKIGCDKSQGYYMSTPLVEKKFTQRLVSSPVKPKF